MSKTTLTKAIHLMDGWRNRSRNGSSWRYTPLGLVLLLSALFVSNIASAEIVTTTYDFKGQTNGDTQMTVTYSTDKTCTYDGKVCNYFTQIAEIDNPGRFAAQGANKFQLFRNGLYNSNSGGRYFVIDNLYKDDVVTFEDVVGNGVTPSITVKQNATANGNTFTITEKGSLVVEITKTTWIGKITIQHDDAAVWGYDPAVETYDMYNNTDGIQSNNLKPAGFPLDYDDYEAQYLTNLQSGTALNDRVAISQVEYNGYYTPWQIDHGFKSLYNWHNISITNLVEGDRVVITWIGNAKFSSKAEQMAYNGCAAFKDNGNDGDFTEGTDTEIALGMSLEAKYTNWDYNAQANIYTSYPYVITEDGHLDIALAADSRIVKVVIYGDHQAQMVDRENAHETNTSYFDQTGQLEAKQHIVPGGLNVYVGNTDNTQHAEVVMSDQGPVSFVYDQSHFKMARHSAWGSVNVWSGLPATGTYYKFVPEVSGKMWLKFKTASIKYRNYGLEGNNENIDGNGTPNEYTAAVNCPYYLMVQEGNSSSFSQVENPHYYSNGANGFFGADNGNPSAGPDKGITVERGKTYYLYGWWQDGTDVSQLQNYACGVAELIEVTFKPDQLVEPLAKWVESGTTSDNELARVKGYRNVTIKKKSSNIASCEPYIEGDKLKIRNITFVDENIGGGTILIKVGDPNIDADPVFAYTIAYNAGYNPSNVGKDINGTDITKSEGHTWNFSDKPLKGLKWNDKDAEADEVVFGPYFNDYAKEFGKGVKNEGTEGIDENGVPRNGVNSNCFLYEEMNKWNPDGTKHSDWTFNYRVKKNGQFHDPRFLNNYDMEGDNADMMWDTEGLIINAGSTQSCIFDEFMLTSNREINHSDKEQADPDRYIGFLEGGSFIIPKLKKDDRVIIYMGSGEGSGAESMEFHITNARDAVYNIIDPEDFYHAGGSMWNVPDGHKDPYYRGCYHFFAKEDGDMTFEMARGTMCKLYEIRIYRGARECTNGVQENGGGYTILAEKDQSGNVTSKETKSWNLHFRGKGERVADGSGKFSQENEVLTHSGNITYCQNSDIKRLSSGQGIEYTNEGEIGMLRVRVKCMEFNYNYVTDFADRNFTLALHETQSYPYTWDFTDVNGFSSADLQGEYNKYNEITDLSTINAENDGNKTWYEPLGRELSMWDTNKGIVLKPSTEEYVNQNMIFENCKGIDGNQLWANGDVIPETQGLWFYFDNNDKSYDGSLQFTEEGLRLSNTKRTLSNGGSTMGWWNTKMVVPSVPNGAAVYARVKRDNTVKVADEATGSDGATTAFLWSRFQFITEKHIERINNKDVTIVDVGMPEKVDIADNIKNDNYYECRFYKANNAATLTPYSANDGSDEYIVAILNKGTQGELHLTFNGWIVEKLSVSLDGKNLNKYGWATESRERVIDPELTAYLTGQPIETFIATSANVKSKKVTLQRISPYETAAGKLMSKVPEENYEEGFDYNACILHNTNGGKVELLDNKFHLFVPDMHDYDLANETSGEKNFPTMTESILRSKLTGGPVTMYDVDADGNPCTNYILTWQTNQAGWGENDTNQLEKDNDINGVGFYRVQPAGVTSSGHQGYLQFLTSAVRPEDSGNCFILDFGEEGTNSIINTTVETSNAEPNYYNLWGQKLNGQPTQRGVYIINGKKVTVK